MTEDLLERTVADSMRRRADGLREGSPRFGDVEGRAADLRHRRVRRVRLGGTLALVLVFVAVIGAVVLRGPATDDLIVGPAGPGVDPTPVVDAPADRWAVPADATIVSAELPTPVAVGVDPRNRGLEISPYLVVLTTDPDDDLLYGLRHDRWSTAGARFESGAGTAIETIVVGGEAFDPSRFAVVPSPYNAFRPASSFQPSAEGTVDLDTAAPNPYLDATAAELLAAPESHPSAPALERLGAYDWVVPGPRCEPDGTACVSMAIGGDAQTLVVVTARGSSGLEMRDHLRALELRPAGSLELTATTSTVDPTVQTVRFGYGWFLSRWVPTPLDDPVGTVPRDDSVWPADVPADYCSAYRAWKDTQIHHLGSFGTAGWIRWAQSLAAMAPTSEVADAYAVLAAEQGAGRDTSATEPGVSAITTVVTDGDARCPI